MDLLDYLYCLHDFPCESIDCNGVVRHSNYRDYGKYLFDRGKNDFSRTALEFGENAKIIKYAPGGKAQLKEIPDFMEDERFGLMAKYAIAWDGMMNAILSESSFFSIEHILESGSEVECSILLASNLYYKQSLQVLRNFLEEVLMELYFCSNRHDFNSWKQRNYKIPSFRGNKGILKHLVVRGILQQELADSASYIYGKLNSSIHGEEDKLINTGVFEGNWTGKQFDYSKFSEWCSYFSRCVDAGIRIARLTTNQWRNEAPIGIFCDICHTSDYFELIEKLNAGDKTFVTLRCTKCGTTRTYDAVFASEHGYSS